MRPDKQIDYPLDLHKYRDILYNLPYILLDYERLTFQIENSNVFLQEVVS